MEEERTLPAGSVRDRILLQMEQKGFNQKELAARIGMNEGSLSRYLNGVTETLGDGNIIKLAKLFQVSTDYLLGETRIPDRMNYDIQELGLTEKAARALYSGEVDASVVSSLIENEHFARITAWISINRITRTGQEGKINEGLKEVMEQLIDEHVRIHHEDYRYGERAKRDVHMALDHSFQSVPGRIEHEFGCAVEEIMNTENGSTRENQKNTIHEMMQILHREIRRKTHPFNFRKTTKDMIFEAMETTVRHCGVPGITMEVILKEFRRMLDEEFTGNAEKAG